MATTISILILLLALSATTATTASKPLSDPTAIEQAFARDNFTVQHWYHYGSNAQGCIAAHRTATNLRTGLPKVAYYVEGTGYEMGFLTGLMASDEIAVMATTFIERFVLQIIDYDEAEQLQNTTEGKALNQLLERFLIDEANAHWAKEPEGVFPQELQDEMQGLVDGAHSVNKSNPISFERMVTLNFGFDWLSALAFSGNLSSYLTRMAQSELTHLELTHSPLEQQHTMQRVIKLLQTQKHMFNVPAHCDAFGTQKQFSQSGKDVFFARSFQLATSDVMQDFATHIIRKPTDTRFASVSVFAPGLVGSITSVGAGGVAMGVDTLRSAAGTPEHPGLGSILLVRHVGDTASSYQSAIDTIVAAKRGCPWLYPLCDVTGTCAVVETTAYLDDGVPFDALRFIQDPLLKAVLPDQKFVDAHNSSKYFRNGVFIRTPDYEYPQAFLDHNRALFEFSRMEYNASLFAPNAMLFETYQQERDQVKHLANNYFTPLRTGNNGQNHSDFIIVSNLAIVPEMRYTMMSEFSDLFGKLSDCAQFRYDTLNVLLNQYRGKLTMDSAIYIASFLSPDRLPGFWDHTINPADPMSAQVEGALSVVWLADANGPRFEIHTKTGYWRDDFVVTSLKNYL